MHSLESIVTPLITLGAIGVFIDFYIGKTGRKEATDKFCKIWSKSYDRVKFSTFARLEARYVIELFDWAFGSRLLSWHRLSRCLCTVTICFLGFFVEGYAHHPAGFVNHYIDWRSGSPMETWVYCAISIGVTIVSLAFSLSLVRCVSIWITRVSNRPLPQLMAFIALLGVHVMLLIYWTPLSGGIRFFASNLSVPNIRMASMILRGAHFALPNVAPPPLLESVPEWTDGFVAFGSNALRIIIAFGFLLAFIFREWINRYVDRLMARLQEDDPPQPYTRVLGFLGAVASGLKAVASLFSGNSH